MTLDQRKLYWAAGFYEGEGTVRINKRGGRRAVSMGFQIINCDLAALEMFKEGVGGLGSIRGPYGPYGVSKKQTYVWCVNGAKDAAAVQGLLLPLLSPRRQQQIREARAQVDAYAMSRIEAFL